jgi:pyruvate dehydrogenase E1 component alpha subunit
VARARAGDGPTQIECKTYRWRTHIEGEPDTDRPPEEVEAWRSREPIAPFRRLVIQRGTLSEAEAEGIEARVVAELDEAVAFARQSPFPEPETALEDVWA